MKARLLIAGLLLSVSLSAQDVERVEPPNWWTNMRMHELHLLIYGKNISTLQPVINDTRVKLNEITRVKNPNYLFLRVNIAKNASAGTVPIKFYKGKKLVQTYDFEIVQRTRKGEDIIGFTPEDVMYLITPDRFANGDPTNDEYSDMPDKLNRSDKLGRHGGDIKGMVNSLDYLHDLGFTAIWINPIIENDMPVYSYHGYAATDFYKVDRRYGTNEEYRDLCAIAKDKGIKVIMDMIMNHCGSEHWFVKDPPMDDWLNNQDHYVRTTHRRNVNQDTHASEYDKKAFTDGWFVKSMPDLNQRNRFMASYLIQNTIWWIEYSGISGIRMDTYPYPDKFFMSDWTCAVLNEYPNINIVGEEWTTNPAIVSYWQRGKVNQDGYTSCLPSLMDFPLQNAVKEGLSEEEKQHGSGLIKMYNALSMDFQYADPDNLVVFPDNHDMDRFYTQVHGDDDLFKMGLIYFATVRGIPQFYYGTEVLLNNEEFPGDHGMIRSDFPGGWPGDQVNAFTGKGLSEAQKEAQDFMKALLNWRQGSDAVHHGKLIHFAPENGIYAFFRISEMENIMVIFNKNEEARTIDFAKFTEALDGNGKAQNVLSGDQITLSEGMQMAGKTAIILKIR